MSIMKDVNAIPRIEHIQDGRTTPFRVVLALGTSASDGKYEYFSTLNQARVFLKEWELEQHNSTWRTVLY